MQSRRWKLFFEFLHGNKVRFFAAMLSRLLTVIIGFITPLVLAETIDAIIANKRPLALPEPFLSWVNQMGGREFLLGNLWIMAAALLLLSLISGVFMFLRGRYSAVASENVAKTIRDKLYGHLQSLSFDYHVKAETGDLIQRCTSDVETIRRFLAGQLVEVFRSIVMVIIAVVIMLRMNVQMTLVSIVMVPLLFFSALLFFRMVQKRFRISDEAEGKMSAVLQENLTAVRVVRAFGRERFETDKFDKVNDDLRDKNWRLMKLMSFYWSSSDLLSMAQSGITLLFGVFLAVRGEMLVGELTVFTSYVGMLLWPVRSLGRILNDLGKALVSVERIDEILRQKEEPKDEDGQTPPIDRDIVFDHVSFAYGNGHQVLNDVSFTVKQGQTVAILGATGSGKSSLVHLLQRLYDVSGGKVTIGGVDISRIQKKWLRSRVGLLLQEPFLYSRSVYENVGIAVLGAGQDEVYTAAEVAHAHGFIKEFENGYDTMVGERGVTLSGGQKQRVAIARTLLKDNDILIFDDSLSAVDTETDAAIRRALKNRKKGITTFIISHRLTTLAEADFIIVLEDGRITQRGTHQELVAEEGLYRRVHNIQNALEEELARDAG